MKQYKVFKDINTRMLYQIARDESMFPQPKLEPGSTPTKRAVQILGARYEKADLLGTVNNNCSHLNPLQQAKLLAALQRNTELFDGTLGYFQTDPVKFHLQLSVLIEKSVNEQEAQ